MRVILSLLLGTIMPITHPADRPRPLITVSCQEHWEIPPESPLDMWDAEIKYSWNARHCDHVLIIGRDTLRHDTTGTINGGSYIFAGVQGEEIILSPTQCILSSDKKGDGEFGVVVRATPYLTDELFKDAYHVSISTTINEKTLETVVISILQDMGFPVATQNCGIYQLCFFTTRPSRHQLVCEGNDCNTPWARQRVQRQIAFFIRFDRSPFISDQSDPATRLITMEIHPFVMRRWRREGIWEQDPDESQVGLNACRDLANRIVNALR